MNSRSTSQQFPITKQQLQRYIKQCEEQFKANIQPCKKPSLEARMFIFAAKHGLWRGFPRKMRLLNLFINILVGLVMKFTSYIPIAHVVNTMQVKRSKKEEKSDKYAHLNVAIGRYLNAIAIDLFFHFPVRYGQKFRDDIRIEGIENLRRALIKGKGAIIPSAHVGSYFQMLTAIAQTRLKQPLPVVKNGVITNKTTKKMDVVLLLNPVNASMIEILCDRFEHVHLIIKNNIEQVKNEIDAHLANNHIIVLMIDYSEPNQLRVPFDKPPYDFLFPIPQLVSSYSNRGIPVVPGITLHNGTIHRSTVRFLPVMEMEEEGPNYAKKERYGMFSYRINQIINPYIAAYLHCWESIWGFARRGNLRLSIPESKRYSDFLRTVMNWLKIFIDNSFVPNRKDTEILEKINEIESIADALNGKSYIAINESFSIPRSFIDVSLLSSNQVLKKISRVVIKQTSPKTMQEFPQIQQIFEDITQL